MTEQLTLFCRDNGIFFQTRVPMKNLTTFKIGGACDILAQPESEDQIAKLIRFCAQEKFPVFIIGKGSNLLVSDEGVRGLVILLSNRFSDLSVNGAQITCQAGCSLSKLCKFAARNGLSGLEFAYGIPGTAGGAVYMNAGAYGREMKNVVFSTKHINAAGQTEIRLSKDLNFQYRKSWYTDESCCITSITFDLTPDEPALIEQRMNEFMAKRLEKQPLELPSAGSTFKRPEGAFAGALIERCGLKGYSVGGASVSEKHAGFVVNQSNATCRDTDELIKTIQQTVFEKTGYRLDCEVKRIGP